MAAIVNAAAHGFRRPSVVPGYGMALGLTLTYLSLIVLIPLAGMFVRTATLTWAEFWAIATDARTLAARGIGALRHRDSPGIQGGYISNGCVECDELVGRILLDDLLDEHLRNGGTYAQLDTGLSVHLPPPGAEPWLLRSA